MKGPAHPSGAARPMQKAMAAICSNSTATLDFSKARILARRHHVSMPMANLIVDLLAPAEGAR